MRHANLQNQTIITNDNNTTVTGLDLRDFLAAQDMYAPEDALEILRTCFNDSATTLF